MGKIFETKITDFSDGIVADPRSPSGHRIITNFDTIDKYRLIPRRSSEAGDALGNTNQIQNFAIALKTGTTYRLFGLGKQSALARHEIFYKELTTGSGSDLDDDDWSSPTHHQAGAHSQNFECFVYYKQTGLIYGLQGDRYVFAFDPTDAAAFDDMEKDLTAFANAAQGLVHSKDDILYIPYDNKIAKFDGTTWTAAALTLPKHLYITSICEHGNYLAIACAPLSGIGKSIVYLWDRDASLATLSESIDWGEGNLKVLEEVEGILIGISDKSASTFNLDDKITIRYLSGSKSKTLIEFSAIKAAAGDVTASVETAKQKIRGRLYFTMSIIINGTIRDGIWSIGRQLPNSPFALVNECSPNNDTSIHSATTALTGSIKSFIQVGDFLFIAYYDGSSSEYAISKTLATATYTAKSIHETRILRSGGSNVTKKLKGVTAMFEPLPAAGQIVLKYMTDEDTTWITLFTETTDNAIRKSAIGRAVSHYKEIQFQILSTGKAVPTGLYLKEEEVKDDSYG